MLSVSPTSASSASVAGLPIRTSSFAKPEEFAVNPFASGVPTVRTAELRTGGLQEGNVNAGPWVLLDAVHCDEAGHQRHARRRRALRAREAGHVTPARALHPQLRTVRARPDRHAVRVHVRARVGFGIEGVLSFGPRAWSRSRTLRPLRRCASSACTRRLSPSKRCQISSARPELSKSASGLVASKPGSEIVCGAANPPAACLKAA